MKKALFGLMGLSLMILMASAYSITVLQTQSAPVAIDAANVQDLTDASKIDSGLARLKSQLSEIESLEAKIQTAPLDQALVLGAELNEKLKLYGSVESLQAALKVLNELKSEFQKDQAQAMKSSNNTTVEI